MAVVREGCLVVPLTSVPDFQYFQPYPYREQLNHADVIFCNPLIGLKISNFRTRRSPTTVAFGVTPISSSS